MGAARSRDASQSGAFQFVVAGAALLAARVVGKLNNGEQVQDWNRLKTLLLTININNYYINKYVLNKIIK